MIGYLNGIIKFSTIDSIVLDVNGVGYRVEVPDSSIYSDNQELELFIYTYVREDSLRLFGFGDSGQLSLFELLISVNGIGPKVAMALLSTFEPGRMSQIILSEDVAALTSAPGIGKKGAERLIIELKSKVGDLNMNIGDAAQADVEIIGEARDALMSLGFDLKSADAAVAEVAEENELDKMTTEELVKQALKRVK